MKSFARAFLVVLIPLAGCARTGGTPRVDFGAPCAACGMTVQDPHFACVRRDGNSERQYDSIECLLHDGRPAPGEEIFLADYDRSALLPAESLWVVKGTFPSPMGGGLAAFSALGSAREVASRTKGRVARLAELVGGAS